MWELWGITCVPGFFRHSVHSGSKCWIRILWYYLIIYVVIHPFISAKWTEWNWRIYCSVCFAVYLFLAVVSLFASIGPTSENDWDCLETEDCSVLLRDKWTLNVALFAVQSSMIPAENCSQVPLDQKFWYKSSVSCGHRSHWPSLACHCWRIFRCRSESAGSSSSRPRPTVDNLPNTTGRLTHLNAETTT